MAQAVLKMGLGFGKLLTTLQCAFKNVWFGEDVKLSTFNFIIMFLHLSWCKEKQQPLRRSYHAYLFRSLNCVSDLFHVPAKTNILISPRRDLVKRGMILAPCKSFRKCGLWLGANLREACLIKSAKPGLHISRNFCNAQVLVP